MISPRPRREDPRLGDQTREDDEEDDEAGARTPPPDARPGVRPPTSRPPRSFGPVAPTRRVDTGRARPPRPDPPRRPAAQSRPGAARKPRCPRAARRRSAPPRPRSSLPRRRTARRRRAARRRRPPPRGRPHLPAPADPPPDATPAVAGPESAPASGGQSPTPTGGPPAPPSGPKPVGAERAFRSVDQASAEAATGEPATEPAPPPEPPAGADAERTAPRRDPAHVRDPDHAGARAGRQGGGPGRRGLRLSRELQLRGNTVEIILPKYDCLRYDHIWGLHVSYQDLWVPWWAGACNCTSGPGGACRRAYFIEPHSQENYFQRGKFYGDSDDVLRFAFFSRAAMEFVYKSGKRPRSCTVTTGRPGWCRSSSTRSTRGSGCGTRGSASRCTTSSTRARPASTGSGPPSSDGSATSCTPDRLLTTATRASST
jgi:starch synthase